MINIMKVGMLTYLNTPQPELQLHNSKKKKSLSPGSL